jgi:hypothetical protein
MQARASMDATSAAAVLQKSLKGSPQAHGLCGRVTAGQTHPRFADLRRGKLIFTDTIIRGGASTVSGAGVTASATTREYRPDVEFVFDFNAVERVFIMGPAPTGQCSASPGNLPVNLKDAEGMFIVVDLAPENYEAFMASVMFLSPKARFTQGAGL